MGAMMLSLSHKLSENTPFYEGLAKPSLERVYDLSLGDTCNSFYFRSSNHCGTHVDGPWHFNAAGRKISDYDINELVFYRPAILDVPMEPAHLIEPGDLLGITGLDRKCDILLLRTGFGKYRSEPKKYVEDAPGFSRAAADYVLRELPDLRALAVDFISLAALKHMEEGCEAHRVFLGCPGYSDRTVLLIEDASLPQDLGVPGRIILAPWFFEGLDSSPCTLLAEFDNQRRA
jgi:arylformamidase